MTELRRAEVYVFERHAGALLETDAGYTFTYAPSYLHGLQPTPVSLTLPLSALPYERDHMFPFFDGIIPEGWLLQVATENWKLDSRDRFGLLQAVCHDVIGNVRVGNAPEDVRIPVGDASEAAGSSLTPVRMTKTCLHCGRPLSLAEAKTGWHKKCVRSFFGTETLPALSIDDTLFERLACRSVSQGITVAGVQKKLSLHLFSDPQHPRLTLLNYPAGYILKPPEQRFPHMPEAEHLAMSMADICGIATVPHALITADGQYAYITKRVDRSSEAPGKLAMEDFAQLGNRLTENKYAASCEGCARIIQKYSARPMLDLSELFMRLIFSFLTGNSDMHLKNYSLMETVAGRGEYTLSPAYDLLPVQLLLDDKEESALALNGRKTKLRRKDFLAFAATAGVPETAARKMLANVLKKVPALLAMAEGPLLPAAMGERFRRLLEERARILA